jgi:hypothetical protein
VDAPIMPAIATTCGYPNVDPTIGEAQKLLPDKSWGIFQGPDTDATDFSLRYDGCHFNLKAMKMIARESAQLIPLVVDHFTSWTYHSWPGG